MAVYPNWFPFTTSHFATGLEERVTIEHNVICGGPTKLVVDTKWDPLDGDVAPGHVIDELDTADVESEDAHDYEGHGFATASIVEGKFDGGRIIPAGERESFETLVASPYAFVILRSDRAIDARIEVGGAPLEITARAKDGWVEAKAGPMSFAAGTRIAIVARAWLRDFHVWIVTQ
jgi:hypothetical protein